MTQLMSKSRAWYSLLPKVTNLPSSNIGLFFFWESSQCWRHALSLVGVEREGKGVLPFASLELKVNQTISYLSKISSCPTKYPHRTAFYPYLKLLSPSILDMCLWCWAGYSPGSNPNFHAAFLAWPLPRDQLKYFPSYSDKKIILFPF